LVSTECVIHITVSLMAAFLWGCVSRLGYPLQKLASDDNRSLLITVERADGIRIATHTKCSSEEAGLSKT